MKTKIHSILALIVLAASITGCGQSSNSDLAFDETSDNYNAYGRYGLYNGLYSEYGRCNDGWDNDGNGLKDEEDPACHFNAGPLRDLSTPDLALAPNLISPGHNFVPDVSKIPLGGPGYPGGFRDYEQMADWFAVLTNVGGWTSGLTYGPGVDPKMVPAPAPSIPHLRRGTSAQGNNNNLDQNVYFPSMVRTPIGEQPGQAIAEVVSSESLSSMSASDAFDASDDISKAPRLTTWGDKKELKRDRRHLKSNIKHHGVRKKSTYGKRWHKYADKEVINGEVLSAPRRRGMLLPADLNTYSQAFGGFPDGFYSNQDPSYPGTGGQGFLGGVINPN